MMMSSTRTSTLNIVPRTPFSPVPTGRVVANNSTHVAAEGKSHQTPFDDLFNAIVAPHDRRGDAPVVVEGGGGSASRGGGVGRPSSGAKSMSRTPFSHHTYASTSTPARPTASGSSTTMTRFLRSIHRPAGPARANTSWGHGLTGNKRKSGGEHPPPATLPPAPKAPRKLRGCLGPPRATSDHDAGRRGTISPPPSSGPSSPGGSSSSPRRAVRFAGGEDRVALTHNGADYDRRCCAFAKLTASVHAEIAQARAQAQAQFLAPTLAVKPCGPAVHQSRSCPGWSWYFDKSTCSKRWVEDKEKSPCEAAGAQLGAFGGNDRGDADDNDDVGGGFGDAADSEDDASDEATEEGEDEE